jgi:hypothetical protein
VSLGLPNKKKEQTVISLDFVFFSVGDDEKIN